MGLELGLIEKIGSQHIFCNSSFFACSHWHQVLVAQDPQLGRFCEQVASKIVRYHLTSSTALKLFQAHKEHFPPLAVQPFYGIILAARINGIASSLVALCSNHAENLSYLNYVTFVVGSSTITPSNSEGTSESTLSVAISAIGSSSSTVSPTPLSGLTRLLLLYFLPFWASIAAYLP